MEQLDFGWLADNWQIIARGVVTTLTLAGFGGIGGIVLGLGCAVVRVYGSTAARAVTLCYTEFVRNTPFLIQLLFIYLGLPAFGVRMPAYVVAGVAMVINLGAYSAEIIRAGIEATPRGLIEAGAALALSPTQIFLLIVLRPSLDRVWPALSSQLVLELLGSAVVAQISVQDLTYAANFIQSRNFRAFETYIVATVIYLVLALLLRQALGVLGWSLLSRRAGR